MHKYSREVGTEKKNRLKILTKMYMDMFTINRLVKCSMILLVLLKLDKAVLYTVVVAQLKVVVHLVIYFPYLLYMAECIMRSLRLTSTSSMDTSLVKGVLSIYLSIYISTFVYIHCRFNNGCLAK